MARIMLPARVDSCAPAMEFLREHLAADYADILGFVELAFKRVSMDSAPFLCVWIRDWGTSFDPFMETATPDTSLAAEDRPIGGLGVHLVKNVSAHHCYSGDDGTNTIELYFQLAHDEN